MNERVKSNTGGMNLSLPPSIFYLEIGQPPLSTNFLPSFPPLPSFKTSFGADAALGTLPDSIRLARMMFDATFSSLRFILMHVGRPSVGPMVSKATDYVSLDPLRRNVTPRHGFLIELLPFENEGPVFRQRTEEKGSRRTSLASRVCRTPSFHSLSPIVKLASCSGTIFLSLSLSLSLSLFLSLILLLFLSHFSKSPYLCISQELLRSKQLFGIWE